jgi:hypothetical protein
MLTGGNLNFFLVSILGHKTWIRFQDPDLPKRLDLDPDSLNQDPKDHLSSANGIQVTHLH